MRGLWSPEVEPSVEEQRILSRCRKAKLFVFLRQSRHELFATPEALETFGRQWQERVRQLLVDCADDPRAVVLSH